VSFLWSFLFTPGRVFSHILPICQALLLVTSLYGLYVLVLALKHKREGAFIFLAGFIILSLGTINDIIHVEKMIQTGYFAAFGFFVFIFFSSLSPVPAFLQGSCNRGSAAQRIGSRE